MFKDRQKLYQVYHTLLSVVLTWALTLAINHYYELKVPIFLCAMFSLVPASLIYLFDINRKNTISYLIILSVFPILTLIFWIRKFNPVFWFEKLIQWCNTYDQSEELYNGTYAKFLTFGVALAGSIIFYILMKRQTAKIILALVFFTMLMVLGVNQVNISKAVVAVSLFYILTILVELCGILYSRKIGRQDKRAGILYLAPICFLLAILSIGLPSRPEPIQWKGVKQIYHNIKDQINVWALDLEYYFSKGKSEFTLQFTGYDDEGGELGDGGNLNKDDKIALEVSGYKGDNPIYLIGSVSDQYTGYSWEKSHQDFIEDQKEYFLDYTELIYALARQDKKILEEQNLIERKSLTVEFYNIKTKTCFYPLKSSWINTGSKKSVPQTQYANLSFTKPRGKGTTYKVVSYGLNLQNQAFARLLREADNFSYDNAPQIKEDSYEWLQEKILYYDNVNAGFNEDVTFPLLKQRSEMIHNLYTKLPDTLPERVRNLAEDIAEEYETDYDKLKAIELYLNSYQYTLHPGKIPEGEDFVDYFLFENKKGYCTSFATAMAVLARCVDIPTRYVEGFVVTYKNHEETNMHPVRNSQSHAWAEAYINGVGWIPFEATSNYYNVRYAAWKDEPSEQSAVASQYADQYAHQAPVSLPDINEADYISDKEEGDSFDILTGAIIVIAAIFIMLFILAVYYSILKYNYALVFEKSDYSKKMYMLFLRILMMLKREGFVLEQQETIRMLAQRLKEKFPYVENEFSKVADIFMHYRYAGAQVTKEEFELVYQYQKELLTKQQKEQKRLRLLVEDLVFLSKKSNR
jgi:transglutaminase-like putative cysteine protease